MDHRSTVVVNDPLEIDGNKVYLTSHGYSMIVTVRDGKGNVAYDGPVPFLPMDGNLTSQGVVKVPDAVGPDGKREQLGFAGLFIPTTTIDPVIGPQSTFPAAGRPDLFLTAYHGDLGMDAGLPQNVYQLDTTNKNLHQFKGPDGQPLKAQMAPGDTLQLPDGAGSITFDRVDQWANFEIVHQPGIPLALGSALCMLVGPRRLAVHPAPPGVGAGAAGRGRSHHGRAGRARPQRVPEGGRGTGRPGVGGARRRPHGTGDHHSPPTAQTPPTTCRTQRSTRDHRRRGERIVRPLQQLPDLLGDGRLHAGVPRAHRRVDVRRAQQGRPYLGGRLGGSQ